MDLRIEDRHADSLRCEHVGVGPRYTFDEPVEAEAAQVIGQRVLGQQLESCHNVLSLGPQEDLDQPAMTLRAPSRWSRRAG